ncbi:TBC1 domain family member 13-like isoform X2 [Lolium rigidum]|uniref:TBC1 domain family member 13-like isoform X2 n=1 Tax=Lolium rigidum TaxID=89674 RepID=UPI001F5D3E4D|nr:TBC1 domain family member 13-like isoform X2 [Lolium rigidum]
MASSPRSPQPAAPAQAELEISRQSRILAALSKKVIDLDELRMLSAQGVPDGAGVRSTVWKLLLGYLPSDRELWEQELTKKRSQYEAFKDEFLGNTVGGNSATRGSEDHSDGNAEHVENGFLDRSVIAQDEHPLSLGKTKEWDQFVEVDRDVKRTHPDMHFFCGDSSFAKSNQESLKNILIIFAKLNAGIRYVQGMNEILAPLFFVFRDDPDYKNANFAEADSFFCFVELLSGLRDNFCQKLDNSAVGIQGTLSKLMQLLRKYDGELQHHLEITTEVNPQFYAFRWITLLLTQEFNFADTIHIWDTLLSDPDGPQETLLRICCAMLILVRKRLLAGDFTSNLKLLQSYPPTNIGHLLYVANKLQ